MNGLTALCAAEVAKQPLPTGRLRTATGLSWLKPSMTCARHEGSWWTTIDSRFTCRASSSYNVIDRNTLLMLACLFPDSSRYWFTTLLNIKVVKSGISFPDPKHTDSNSSQFWETCSNGTFCALRRRQVFSVPDPVNDVTLNFHMM